MLVYCSNSGCARQFHQPSQARLYFLPPSDYVVERFSEYCYWLCPECSIEFAIKRHEGQVVVIANDDRDVRPPLQLLLSGRWDRT
jgi:hypothetical protein